MTKKAPSAAGDRPRHPWRENIEALVVAIAVAMLFKYFVLEISKIPSGSMQPTLMGSPETGVFDRVLVDKLSFVERDPERWEIVVFRHPIERSRIMVKRLVGMPGEQLRIEYGDLWTRPDDASEWQHLRRPSSVQEAMWRAIDLEDPPRTSWSRVLGDADVRANGRDIVADGPVRLRFLADQVSIRDRYTDGYPDALRSRIVPQDPRLKVGLDNVGDLRVRGRVVADQGLTELRVQLTEDTFAYDLVLPGPAAASDARPSIEVRENGKTVATASGESPLRLGAGKSARFAAWNLDDRLTLALDGEELVSLDIAPVADQSSSVMLDLEGGGAHLDDLMVDRDIYYLTTGQRTWDVTIPDGSYVMLGDNTQDSADGRDWKAQRWVVSRSDGTSVTFTGNFRSRGENPSPGKGPDGAPWTRFKDRWGEIHWFPSDEGRAGLPYPEPLVPRELIQGRALAVFWPLEPWAGIWRLGWLH